MPLKGLTVETHIIFFYLKALLSRNFKNTNSFLFLVSKLSNKPAG